MFDLMNFSSKCSLNISAQDYIVDLVSFSVEKDNVNEYKASFELIILGSRDSKIFAYIFENISTPSNYKELYVIEKAHLSRLLCLRKIEVGKKFNNFMKDSLYFASGGLNNKIYIWDALKGIQLQEINLVDENMNNAEHLYSADMITFFQYEDDVFFERRKDDDNFNTYILSVGTPNALNISSLESDSKSIHHKNNDFSYNVIEPLYDEIKGKRRIILFATADKGYCVNVWRMESKSEQLTIKILRIVKVHVFWVLSLSSFPFHKKLYSRKYLLACGGSESFLPKKVFQIAIFDWRKSQILRLLKSNHVSWINTLRSAVFIKDGNEINAVISGSADGIIKVWDIMTGDEIKSYGGDNVVVMHGMRLCWSKNENKYFIVNGGKNSENEEKKQLFKIWC